MRYLQELENLKIYSDNNKIELQEKEILENTIINLLEQDISLFRNVLYKNIAKLAMKLEISSKINNSIKNKKHAEVELLSFVLSQLKRQNSQKSFSKSVIAKLRFDDEWLNLFFEASFIYPKNELIKIVLNEILNICKYKDLQLLFSLVKLCQYQNDVDILDRTIKIILNKIGPEEIYNVEFLHWLYVNGISDHFNSHTKRILAAPFPKSQNVIEVVNFYVKNEEWELTIKICHKILFCKRLDIEPEIVLFASSKIIYAYIKLKDFDKIEPIYSKYWENKKDEFPYIKELVTSCHLIESGEDILKDLCTKDYGFKEVEQSYQKAIIAKKLEYQKDWKKALGFWQEVIEDEPENPAYLRFISLNIIQSQSRPRKAKIYGEQLSRIEGYDKLGCAVVALSNRGRYNELVNDVLNNGLYLETGDIVYDMLIQDFIPIIWNLKNKWDDFLRLKIINEKGMIIHEKLKKRVDFTNKYLIGNYNELTSILNNTKATSDDIKRFVQIFNALIRIDLKTSHLRALLKILNTAEIKQGFFKRDEFEDYQLSEVRSLRNSFLWLLAKRAEYEYKQKGIKDKQLEIEISSLELNNAESVFRKINI